MTRTKSEEAWGRPPSCHNYFETLKLRGPLGAFIALTPVSERQFFYRHLYAGVTFVTETEGKVQRLDWTDTSGKTYPCKKIADTYPDVDL